MWTLQEEFQLFKEGDPECLHDFIIRANMEKVPDNEETKVHYKVCTICGRLEKKFETRMPDGDFENIYEKFFKTTISDNLAGVFTPTFEEAFEIDVASNDDRVLGDKVRIKFTMMYSTQDSSTKPFTLKALNEKSGLFENVPFNPGKVYWFGPEDGFPLVTRKYFFKINFNTNGVYKYKIELVRLEDEKILAADDEELNVATAKL